MWRLHLFRKTQTPLVADDRDDGRYVELFWRLPRVTTQSMEVAKVRDRPRTELLLFVAGVKAVRFNVNGDGQIPNIHLVRRVDPTGG